MIDEGTYKGKLAEWGIAMTPNGKWHAVITFDVEGKNMSWNGWFVSEASSAVTMENLARCGWKGADKTELYKLNVEGNKELELGKEMSVTIEHEWNEKAQKTFANISYINDLGVRNQMSPEDVAKEFGGTVEKPAEKPIDPKSDDIPF